MRAIEKREGERITWMEYLLLVKGIFINLVGNEKAL